MRVAAVLTTDRPAPEGADEVVHAATLAEGVDRALRTTAGWFWLVDDATTPSAGALDAFRAVLDSDVPAPLVLQSKVVGPDGSIDLRALPNPEMFEKDAAVAAAEQGLLQIRASRPGSLLVARRAVERFGGPRPDLEAPYDVLEWTARILRSWDDIGYLVPSSVAVRDSKPSSAGLKHRAKALLTGPGWTPTEKLWNAYTMVVGPVRKSTL